MILIYFSLILVALVLLWHLLTKKYINPYQLYILFGPKGVGKSTMLQKLAFYYKKKGYNIYCNIGDCSLSFVTPIKIEDIGLLSKAYKDKSLQVKLRNDYQKQGLKVACAVKPNSVIFCDEINLIWDNRSFKQFTKEQQYYFRKQRHYKHKFIGFSQTFDCDKKIRDLADYVILMNKIGRVWIRGQSWRKKQKVVGATDENNRDEGSIVDNFVPMGFIYNFFFSPFNCWLPKWVKKHDSWS